MELKRYLCAWAKLGPNLIKRRESQRLNFVIAVKSVREKNTSPISEMRNVEGCPGVQGCCGIVPSWLQWQGIIQSQPAQLDLFALTDSSARPFPQLPRQFLKLGDLG